MLVYIIDPVGGIDSCSVEPTAAIAAHDYFGEA